MDKGTKVIMTADGLKNLKKELDLLKSIERKKIAVDIQKAIEYGDLSENAQYTAAVERRDLVEARIIEIEQTLENVEVYTASSKKDGTIQIGRKFKLKVNSTSTEWELVGALEGDPAKRKIAIDTPLGSALVGKKAGEKVKVDLPSSSITYEIVSVA